MQFVRYNFLNWCPVNKYIHFVLLFKIWATIDKVDFINILENLLARIFERIKNIKIRFYFLTLKNLTKKRLEYKN